MSGWICNSAANTGDSGKAWSPVLARCALHAVQPSRSFGRSETVEPQRAPATLSGRAHKRGQEKRHGTRCQIDSGWRPGAGQAGGCFTTQRCRSSLILARPPRRTIAAGRSCPLEIRRRWVRAEPWSACPVSVRSRPLPATRLSAAIDVSNCRPPDILAAASAVATGRPPAAMPTWGLPPVRLSRGIATEDGRPGSPGECGYQPPRCASSAGSPHQIQPAAFSSGNARPQAVTPQPKPRRVNGRSAAARHGPRSGTRGLRCCDPVRSEGDAGARHDRSAAMVDAALAQDFAASREPHHRRG